jgi:hypothetical protein
LGFTLADMAPLPNEFDFLEDPSLDPEIKKTLLAGLLEEKRHARDNALKVMEAQSSQALEKKKLWHNTPLMLALVGTISVFANGLVAYVQAGRTTSDTITLKQLEAQLKESEERSKADRDRQLSELKQQMGLEASEAEARQTATKEEREFAFKIIERELGKTGDSASRAEVLLFLARAGILNSLNRSELEKMAIVQIEKSGRNVQEIGIPPTLGRVRIPVDLTFFEAGMTISADGWPEGRRFDPADWEPTTSLLQPGTNASLDASIIPYVALPISAYKAFGLALGDFAVVYNRANQKLAFAIFGDFSPARYLGQGSIALAKDLEIPTVRPIGPSTGIVYILFPNSRKLGSPITPELIKEEGKKLFEKWGGNSELQRRLAVRD